MQNPSPLVFLQVNEFNFELAQKYFSEEPQKFNAFERLCSWKSITTSSEIEYDLLEPWIQWVSCYTGQAYSQHKVFRLGDVENSTFPQFMEIIEKLGFSVGVISSMNAVNRLNDPAFFISDPWTKTQSDNSFGPEICRKRSAKRLTITPEIKLACIR